jgi:hypothetical protein
MNNPTNPHGAHGSSFAELIGVLIAEPTSRYAASVGESANWRVVDDPKAFVPELQEKGKKSGRSKRQCKQVGGSQKP